MSEFIIPNLGDGVAQGDVLKVLVKPGDAIAVDQPVLELETDKATIEVPSDVAGTIKELTTEVYKLLPAKLDERKLVPVEVVEPPANLFQILSAALIPLVKPLSVFGPRINQFDLRGSKIFRFGTRRLQANVDAYNLFNNNTPVTLFGTYNARWGQPTQVLDGRLVKFSAQIDF